MLSSGYCTFCLRVQPNTPFLGEARAVVPSSTVSHSQATASSTSSCAPSVTSVSSVNTVTYDHSLNLSHCPQSTSAPVSPSQHDNEMSKETAKHPIESVRKLNTELQAAYAIPEDGVPRKRRRMNPTVRSLTGEYMMNMVKEKEEKQKKMEMKKKQKVNEIW